MLEKPITIRLPREEEISKNSDIIRRLKEMEQATIEEGYKLTQNTDDYLPFSFYAEININNSRLWNLFVALSETMPNRINCIYNEYGKETIVGRYMEKSDILPKLEQLKFELTQDCNLEFGLLFHVEYVLEEILVSETKYIKYWGSHEMTFRETMEKFGLKENADLHFIDEFPSVVEPLTKFHENVKTTDVVLKELDTYFSGEEN